jgi:hypothetical protein
MPQVPLRCPGRPSPTHPARPGRPPPSFYLAGVETKRGLDVTKPGSQDQDPIFNYKLKAHEASPRGWRGVGNQLCALPGAPRFPTLSCHPPLRPWLP